MPKNTKAKASGADVLKFNFKTLITAQDIGNLLHLSREGTRKLSETGVLIQESYGHYSFLISVERYLKHLQDRFKKTTNKDRMDAARAELLELKAERARGNVVDLAIVGRIWADAGARFRTKVLAIPSRLAPQLASMTDAKEINTLLEKMMHEALNELAATTVIGSDEDDGDDMEVSGRVDAASEDDGEPMGRH